jgi:hypothetical protein
MNKRTNWYGIRIFCDVAHKGDLPRGKAYNQKYTEDLRSLCESGNCSIYIRNGF